ncbi:MAG TPA: chemotaxis protein CheA [Burkholderiaceae bacterium]|nr:chemotaxis protein CheA [Burkholderiaceae bacterium]
MDDMLKDFVVEALELATNVEEHLLALERQPDNMETLNAVFRSFHTIKGGAGFMGLPAMVSACHLTENLFDALRTGKAPVTGVAIEAALQASGFVADQLTDLANGAQPEQLSAMPGSLEAILKQAIEGGTAPAVAAAPAAAAPAGNDPATAAGPDWATLYHAVTGIEAGPAATDGAAATAVAAPVAASGWDGVDRRQSETRAAAAPVKEDSIRIDAIKLDALLEVAGESVQAANQASVLLEKLAQFKFEDAATELMAALGETLSRASRYSTELQRATLSTRMQPVGRLFQKFPRLVRELAKDLGKEVELLIEGAETEVDRVVVDSLYDPLVHMLRNSLDHAIEDAQVRLAAGKPGKAAITLKAWQEGSSVMIEVSDDGKGIDPNELRKKAIAKGLIGENAAPTDEEALNLVFLPGFSTKQVASSVSGRGVGMDVVRTAVEKHRGAIRIDSVMGRGTRFLIRLPIELSIVPTLLVRTAGAILAMPMAVVQRVVELPETFDEVGGAPVLRDQGRPLSVRSLAAALGYTPGTEQVGIVIMAPQPYILAVEAVDSTADLVIKPLTALSVNGINGTARSAEGELVLVIGLAYLLEGCRSEARLTA